jgi:D-alanyl-lipoteichoic acid acyltransferase DltB (MBOAT superfamily)
MVIGGLWHGASVNFVIWGTMNGIALILFNHWKKISPYENSTWRLTHFWKIFITFNFITFTRIWFIMQDDAAPITFLNHVWTEFGLNLPTFVKVITTFQTALIIIVVGFIVHWLPKKVKDLWEKTFTRMPMLLQAISVAIIIFFVYQAVSDESRGFVYFLY